MGVRLGIFVDHLPELVGADRLIGNGKGTNRRLGPDRREQQPPRTSHPKPAIIDRGNLALAVGGDHRPQRSDRRIVRSFPIGAARLAALQRDMQNGRPRVSDIKHQEEMGFGVFA